MGKLGIGGKRHYHQCRNAFGDADYRDRAGNAADCRFQFRGKEIRACPGNATSGHHNLYHYHGVGCFCSVAFPKLITRAFTNDPDLLDVTANGLRISLLVFVVVGSQISISQFFQSIGIAWKAMFLSLSRQVLFLIPAMLLFSRFWGWMVSGMLLPSLILLRL